MNPSEQSHITTESYLRTFTIIHLVLIAGPVFSLIFLYEAPTSWMVRLPQSFEVGMILPLIISLGSIVVSGILFKQLTAKYNPETDLKVKMSQLFSASLIRFAILEGAAFYSILMNPDSSNPLYILCALLPLGVMVFWFPRKAVIMEDLKLNREQRMRILRTN